MCKIVSNVRTSSANLVYSGVWIGVVPLGSLALTKMSRRLARSASVGDDGWMFKNFSAAVGRK